jgi:hypothetical protein
MAMSKESNPNASAAATWSGPGKGGRGADRQNLEPGEGLHKPNGPLRRSEDLRVAMVSLQRLTGVVDVEDVLGEIFARFCIGK